MSKTPKEMNGAESVVRSLHAGGVEVCFANPGTSEMQFVDALDRTKLMRCVLGLFEGVVTGAADGYARMAGKPAVTLLHLAPGFANAAANLHNARKARVPMVNLVGDHALRHQKYDAPLSADVEGACAPFSDWVRSGRDAGSFAADAMTALAVAQSKPGKVATLIAPADIGWDAGGKMAEAVAPAAPAPLDERALDAAINALESGEKTVLLVGSAVLESQEAMALLHGIAEKTGADILAPTSNRRMERGQGRFAINKVPYPINAALECLAPYSRAILIETPPPWPSLPIPASRACCCRSIATPSHWPPSMRTAPRLWPHSQTASARNPPPRATTNDPPHRRQAASPCKTSARPWRTHCPKMRLWWMKPSPPAEPPSPRATVRRRTRGWP
ncbi:thiamine pyrophosphate-binding protein [Sulfitobacter profundi]|uniref:Thiamine pyrophosphate-binding protein n=1 Tax=Sulfitobacter profundi TaxID=2679961 RepID=A0ABW1YYG6_9RHOB